VSDWLYASVDTLVSVGVGFTLGRKARKSPAVKEAAPLALVCGCEHELAYHDPSTNQCHDTVSGTPVFKGGKWAVPRVQCTCRQYTGPRPIDQVFSPRISFPEEP
jgi:hypothetical protein